jgi:hypothetical protein
MLIYFILIPEYKTNKLSFYIEQILLCGFNFLLKSTFSWWSISVI